MDTMIVYEDTLHLEICLFASFLVFELNEGVLKAVAGAFVPNDLAGDDLPEAAEDQVQIFV